MLKLILIRGLPGSGKTTLARLIDAVAVAADDYMSDDDGNYKFDPARLSKCHEWCQNTAKNLLLAGANVVVHNTFSRQWEIDPYRKIAELTRAELVIFDLYDGAMTDDALSARNEHAVPRETITKMRDRWEF